MPGSISGEVSSGALFPISWALKHGIHLSVCTDVPMLDHSSKVILWISGRALLPS